jgi:hypothetical protein
MDETKLTERNGGPGRAAERPITKKEAAALLGVSTDTLDVWTARYGIRHVKYDMPGNRGNKGRVVYLREDILAFRDRFLVEDEETALRAT